MSLPIFSYVIPAKGPVTEQEKTCRTPALGGLLAVKLLLAVIPACVVTTMKRAIPFICLKNWADSLERDIIDELCPYTN